MLARLYIENIAVISKAEAEFSPGLNVLTGETGAGKSIVIDALGLALGQRASRDLIRTGEDKAQVTALFFIDGGATDRLAECGVWPEEDGSLVLQRELTADGRSICRINGSMVPLSLLREVGSILVSLHGQQDSQALYSPEKHLGLLDAFSPSISGILEKYREVYDRFVAIRNELSKVNTDEAQRARELDMLNYQINEIEAAGLVPGEDSELEERRRFLANGEKILTALQAAYSGASSARDGLAQALREIGAVRSFDSALEGLYSELTEVSITIDDAVSEMLRIKDNADFDPRALEEAEERLELVKSLKRKYGGSIEAVLEFCEKGRLRREELINSEQRAGALGEELKEIENSLGILSSKLTDERKKTAKMLEDSIKAELDGLEMKGAGFKVIFEKSPEYTRDGMDKAEFLISPNQGEEPKPLAKIASGGELSRIMLAIKTVMAHTDSVPTYIFDEIDTGVSGRAAGRVAKKLYDVSRGRQTLCITHLGQIAAMADRHYLIEKGVSQGRTFTSLKALRREERVLEIARINAGADITGAAVAHAEELLSHAEEYKKKAR